MQLMISTCGDSDNSEPMISRNPVLFLQAHRKHMIDKSPMKAAKCGGILNLVESYKFDTIEICFQRITIIYEAIKERLVTLVHRMSHNPSKTFNEAVLIQSGHDVIFLMTILNHLGLSLPHPLAKFFFSNIVSVSESPLFRLLLQFHINCGYDTLRSPFISCHLQETAKSVYRDIKKAIISCIQILLSRSFIADSDLREQVIIELMNACHSVDDDILSFQSNQDQNKPSYQILTRIHSAAELVTLLGFMDIRQIPQFPGCKSCGYENLAAFANFGLQRALVRFLQFISLQKSTLPQQEFGKLL
jgi:hypothetical protein